MLSNGQLLDAYTRATYPFGFESESDRVTMLAGLRAVEAAVRADMQREVRTVEYQYGVRHDRTGEISTTLTEAASRTYATGTDVVVHPGGREEAFPRALVRRALGPWEPVTPSTPNQQGAEQR